MKDYKPTSYTTTVPVEKTLLEIERLLMRAGATKIAKDYVGDGRVKAFFFAIPTKYGELTFRMPCAPEKVYPLLYPHRFYNKKRQQKAAQQSERVAWRILLTWMSAQLSMIKMEQVTPEQAFFPYAYDPLTQETVFEKLERKHFLMLGTGEQSVEADEAEIREV